MDKMVRIQYFDDSCNVVGFFGFYEASTEKENRTMINSTSVYVMEYPDAGYCEIFCKHGENRPKDGICIPGRKHNEDVVALARKIYEAEKNYLIMSLGNIADGITFTSTGEADRSLASA